jgi:hypothetical protein
MGVTPTTFDLVCVRAVSGTSTCIAAVVYRPGSDAISSAFFAEFMDDLDRLAMLPIRFFSLATSTFGSSGSTTLLQFKSTRSSPYTVSLVLAHQLRHRRQARRRRGAKRPTTSVCHCPQRCLSYNRQLRWMIPLTKPPPVGYGPIVFAARSSGSS